MFVGPLPLPAQMYFIVAFRLQYSQSNLSVSIILHDTRVHTRHRTHTLMIIRMHSRSHSPHLHLHDEVRHAHIITAADSDIPKKPPTHLASCISISKYASWLIQNRCSVFAMVKFPAVASPVPTTRLQNPPPALRGMFVANVSGVLRVLLAFSRVLVRPKPVAACP